MSSPKVGRMAGSITVEPTRSRETPPATITFQNILRGGANVLLSGAQAASTLVGGPLLSAAVSSARAGSDTTLGRAPAASEPELLKSMQDQRIGDDIKLLTMQNEIQRHDRQVTMVSNVMKARHDTAKAAIGNIRS